MKRPGLLTFGIICKALYAMLMLFGAAVAGMVLLGASFLGVFAESLSALPIIGVVGGLGLFLISGFAFLQFLVLGACWGAWNGERGWTWALVILSVIGLVDIGPISVIIGLCTIIGGLQALGVLGGERTREA